MSDAPMVHVEAPAKVNLFLEVLGKRADGFHELETLMLALDLCDRVGARRTSSGDVRCSLSGPQLGADVPADERNLAVRAARACLDLALRGGAADARTGLELELDKHIPSQAGLGGASSDAAAAFRAAERALGFTARSEDASLALASLGSDCSFFWIADETGCARCTGRGEIVEPWPAPGGAAGVLLVTPDARAPTADVYRALGDPLRWRADARSLPERFSPGTRLDAAAGRALFNRLQDAAMASVPALDLWRVALQEAVARPFLLSGSGASFFALFDDHASAAAAVEPLATSLALRGLHPRGLWALRPRRRGPSF